MVAGLLVGGAVSAADEPAFPYLYRGGDAQMYSGLTKREYAAIHAPEKEINAKADPSSYFRVIAKLRAEWADALFTELDKPR